MSDSAAKPLHREREEWVVFQWINGDWYQADAYKARTPEQGAEELAQWQETYPHNIYVLAKRSIIEEPYEPVT